MCKENYVSFETAKLLKEKGFDWECISYYVDYEPNDVKYSFLGETNSTWESRCCSAPTIQMAMKWLREVYDIYIMIDKDFATENGWHYVVVRKQDWVNNIDNGLIQQESNNYTYETACEAAIKYCLENLI